MKKDVLKIEVVKSLTTKEQERVLQINNQNLAKNGGTLHYEGILDYNYVVLAKINELVVGYALLYEKFLTKNDLYVMQVAVDKKYQHLGIGFKMYEFAFNHSKGNKLLTASVNPTNIVSQKFHEKSGFKNCGVNNLGIIYAKTITRKVKKTFDDAKPIYFNIEYVAETDGKTL